MGGGVYVSFGDNDSNRREFFIPPDDLVYITAQALGIDLPDFVDRPSQDDTEDGCVVEVEDDDTDEEEVIETDRGHVFPVDYNRDGKITGGYLEDIPEPHIRKWPGSPHKRELTVRITRYYYEGTHYYISIQEEENPLWNGTPYEHDESRPVGWVVAWDDKEAQGKTDFNFNTDTRFNYITEAKHAVDKILENFPDHEVIYEEYLNDSDAEMYFGKHGE